MSDSVKVDFLAQANIKVPVQEPKAYEELIAQHHDVFSTDKNDLGCANHFEHKIQTKTQLTGNSFQSQKPTETFWWSKFKSG